MLGARTTTAEYTDTHTHTHTRAHFTRNSEGVAFAARIPNLEHNLAYTNCSCMCECIQMNKNIGIGRCMMYVRHFSLKSFLASQPASQSARCVCVFLFSFLFLIVERSEVSMSMVL